MEMQGQYTLGHPREWVWPFLLDAEVLAKVMPGCEKLVPVAEDEYEAVLSVGIAMVRGRYSGRVHVREKTPPSHLLLVVDASGSLGFTKAQVAVDLKEDGRATLLSYQGEVEVGGTLASVGQRMLGGVAKHIIDQTFKSFKAELDRRRAAEGAP